MVNAQEWLDKNYPQEGCLRKYEWSSTNNFGKKRSEIKELWISRQNLVGALDLTDFSSLEGLDCSKNQLTSLNLSNCSELTWLNCAGNPHLTKLDLEPCQKLESLTANKNQLKVESQSDPQSEGSRLDLNKFPNLIGKNEYGKDRIHWSIPAQTWLEENYPIAGVCQIKPKENWKENNQGKTRQQITKLAISSQRLEGSLDLTGFVNLELLNCSWNYLTELIVNNCCQLEKIDCGGNNLANLNLNQVPNLKSLYCGGNNLANLDLLTTFSQLEKLAELDISDNNFVADLAWLTPLVNCQKLWLGNNNFTGSLAPLKNLNNLECLYISHNPLIGSLAPCQNLTKLESLEIDNTDLDSGLEYLPESLEEFSCFFTERLEAKVSKIAEVIGNEYNISKWKKSIKNILTRAEDIQKEVRKLFGGYSQNEISKLKDPDQLGNIKYAIYIPQWTSRIALMTGGGLLIAGRGVGEDSYSVAGGVIAVTAPAIETAASFFEKKYYDKNENKWDRFITDSKELWNDYQELVEVLKPCECFDESSKKSIKEDDSLLVKKTKALHSLWKLVETVYIEKEQSDSFLTKIGKTLKLLKDNPNTEKNPLVTKNKFAQDLQKKWDKSKTQWEKIGEKLVEVSKYQQEELSKIKENSQKELEIKPQVTENTQQKFSPKEVVIDLDEHFETKELNQKLQTKRSELEQLINFSKDKLGQKILADLLETQIELLKNNSSYVQKQFNKIKTELSKDLTEQEIQALCDKQIELIQLEQSVNLQEYQSQIQILPKK